MKRDTSQTQSVFPPSLPNSHLSPLLTSPELTFQFRPPVQHNTTTIHTFKNQPYQRYSQDITNPQPHPTNAFVHLRNQISNLRSQFSKLIQKDHSKVAEKPFQESRENQKRQSPASWRISRMPTYSTIGFSSKGSQMDKNDKKSQKKQGYENTFKFKTKDSETQAESIKTINRTELKIESSRLEDKGTLAKSYLDKRLSNNLESQSIKIQKFQLQIAKLKEQRKKLQQKQLSLQNQLKKQENQYNLKLAEKSNQLDGLQLTLGQENISLSLKNSLIQKLQLELAKLAKQNKFLVNKSIEQFQQYNRQRQRFETAVRQLQRRNQEVIELSAKLAEKSSQYEAANNQRQCIEKQLLKMREENKQLYLLQVAYKQHILQLQAAARAKLQTAALTEQTKYLAIPQQIASKLKTCQQQNTDLRKRVDAFKKSIQQLNASNNGSRQKFVHAKQQIKALQEQLKIKDVLINSLYRDISILDSELRQIPALKLVININNKLIEELNQLLIQRQLQKLSHRYKPLEEI